MTEDKHHPKVASSSAKIVKIFANSVKTKTKCFLGLKFTCPELQKNAEVKSKAKDLDLDLGNSYLR